MADQRSRTLKELIAPEKLRETSLRFVEIVKQSFRDDLRRIVGSRFAIKSDPTQSEIRRRTNIVYTWFTLLRGDMHYSMPKALDLLPIALRKTLDGEDWEPPPAEKGWSPQMAQN